MKQFFFLFCLSFFLLPTFLLGLDSLDQRLLYRALALPPRAEMSLQDITDSLVTFTIDDAQKAEIAFYWISEHIQYDFSDEAETAEVLDLNKVILAQKASVQTFSQLYREMCQMMGLTCHIIPGYVRLNLATTYEYHAYNGQPYKMPERPYHTWNAVKISGNYYFLDISMAGGEINGEGEETVFIREYDLDQILVKGEPFIRTHLPADPRWQNRTNPISLRLFYSNLSYEGMIQKSKTTPAVDYVKAITDYERAGNASQRLMRLTASHEFNPSPLLSKELADAHYGMAYSLSQKDYKNERMMSARRHYRTAIDIYEQLAQTPTIKTLITQAQQGITYVNYRLEVKK